MDYASEKYEDVKDGVVMADALPGEKYNSQRICDSTSDSQNDGKEAESLEQRLNREYSQPSHDQIGDDIDRRKSVAD